MLADGCSEPIISFSLLLVTAANQHEWTSEETEQLTEMNHESCNPSISDLTAERRQ